MLKTIVIAAAVVVAVPVAVVLMLAAGQPDVFRVQRSTTVAAPPAAVYPLIADFRRWAAWSPWEAKDPAMKRSYGAVTAGEGAEYAWEGNRDVGKGRMRITEARAPSRVALALDFEQPFEAHNTVEFTLEPAPAGTEVTWTMQGPTPFLAKIVHVFVDMDRMVGGDFEAGLAKLKTVAEGGRP
jgi:uncharacterized protein YndB with AHSA1/START domain